MKFIHPATSAVPFWRSATIVLDSICTCKGKPESCPIKQAINVINDKFPECQARFTEKFLPRIKVVIQGLIDDPDQAWLYIKEGFPSHAEALPTMPKVVANWKSPPRSNSTFTFEVKPEIRHLLAGQRLETRSMDLVIKNTVHIPFCRVCHKLGHVAARCSNATRPPADIQHCVSCSIQDHHPLDFNCPTKDRLIKAKLARIDYGPSFQHKIVLWQ